MVGKNTYKSDWVDWEIDKAVELGKPVVAIKLNNSNTTPIPLYGINAEWARTFNYEAIKKALDKVYYR
ncbi:TIR domain-containing protein [Lentilactobacillus farraginis]|uniref:TIR domain-containing protein n=1 Tax=Lentilactobacillus farraginis TaxID=390841 RepID=UPI0009DD34B3